jgi:hypothetical protein
MLHGHWQGLLLVKVPKAASSTSAGVVLRIANQSHLCDTTAVQWQHLEGIFYANRTRATSFLVAPIRQPAARAFSSTWFFLLAPLNITDSDENVIRALNTRRVGGKTKGKGALRCVCVAGGTGGDCVVLQYTSTQNMLWIHTLMF